MSRIENLVAERCPKGVEFVELGHLLQYEQPTPYLVTSTSYDDSFATPVLTAGKTFILGYTDETEGVYAASTTTPALIFDDFTTACRWVDFPFKAKSSAMKILRPRDGEKVSLKFVYYAMQCIGFVPSDHTRHWISQYSTFEVPFPPLDVQEEVVRQLDSLADLNVKLAADLEAEIQARRRQYEHYLGVFLASGSASGDPRPLGLIARNLDARRKPITKSARVRGDIPYYGASGVVDFVAEALFDGDYLLVSEDGANLRARSTPIAFSITGKSWVNNHAHVLEFEDYYSRRFVEIFLNSIDLDPYITGAAQPKLNKANLNKILVPDPGPDERERIVQQVDALDALVSQLLTGLRAELVARRKQYEYYRDRLLTFEALAA